MTRILPYLFSIFLSLSLFSQKKEPINLQSIATNEIQYKDILLMGNYYTLKNNIDNKNSSAYISKRPRLKDIQKAATSMPSEYYVLTKDSKLMGLIVLQWGDKKQFHVAEMKSKKESNFPCPIIGDLSQRRAEELIKEGYDKDARISNDTLFFNDKEFKIASTTTIESAVLSLIQQQNLDQIVPEEIIIPSQLEIKNFILRESQPEGKLDLFTPIKDRENDGIQIRPGLFTTEKHAALYKWGRACYDIGVNSAESTVKIYEELTGTSTDQEEKKSIISGYNRDWDK